VSTDKYSLMSKRHIAPSSSGSLLYLKIKTQQSS